MLLLGVSDGLGRGSLESQESGGFSRSSTIGGDGSSLSSDTFLIELVSVEVCLSLGSLVTSSSVELIEFTSNVSLSFLGDGSFNGSLSGGISLSPCTISGGGVGDGLLGEIKSSLFVTGGLGKGANAEFELTNLGDSLVWSTGGIVSLETVEWRLSVTSHGFLELLLDWLSLCFGLGGSEHQWDCDVLKHFAM